jgi:hypothetical protein
MRRIRINANEVRLGAKDLWWLFRLRRRRLLGNGDGAGANGACKESEKATAHGLPSLTGA